MANVVKIAKPQTNAGDADYRPAVNQLGWAIWHARNLGFGVPTNIEAAYKLLTNEITVSFMTTMGGEPFILCCGDAGSPEDFQDQMDMLEIAGRQLKRRRARRREEEEKLAMISGYAWPAIEPADAA